MGDIEDMANWCQTSTNNSKINVPGKLELYTNRIHGWQAQRYYHCKIHNIPLDPFEAEPTNYGLFCPTCGMTYMVFIGDPELLTEAS
jgi:hypothetical protein